MLVFCDALNGNEIMQELNIAGAGLEAWSAKSLCRVLPTMSALRKITCGVGDEVHTMDASQEAIDLSSAGDGSLHEGDKVEADYKGRGKYLKGKVERVNPDGTYDIRYDDGDSERGKRASEVRSVRGLQAHDAQIMVSMLPKCTALKSITFGCETESGYIKKDKTEGASFNVGNTVIYQGRECTVSKEADSDGNLRVRYPPANLTVDMMEADLSQVKLGPGDATIAAAFLRRMA